MNVDEIKAYWPQFSRLILDYFQKSQVGSHPVVRHLSSEQQQYWLQSATSSHQMSSLDDLWTAMEQYLRHSIHTHHPFFLNQLYAHSLWPAVFGDILASVVNTSQSTYEVSPVATLIEHGLIQRMLRMVGFHEGEGLFVTGGSNANLVAMLAARHARYPSLKTKGLAVFHRTYGENQGAESEPLKVTIILVSEEAHYSYLKAAHVLGIGTEQVWRVKSDHLGRMLVSDLKEKIDQARFKGGDPFFIGATAGTTVTGAFDPLEELSEVALRENLWLHVDGAYGGGLLFLKDEKEGEALKGHEKADSFTWDAHKTMGIPLICSAIFFRKKGRLQNAQGGEGGQDYLFHQDTPCSNFDLGPESLQCGKRNDVLKLWLTWQYLGDEGYRQRMKTLRHLTLQMESLLAADEDFHIIVPSQFFNICFQWRPKRYLHKKNPPLLADWNQLNLQLRKKLLQQGEVMFNYSDWKGLVLLRPVFLNSDMTYDDLVMLKNKIKQVGQELMIEM